jgi:hypothetical protein
METKVTIFKDINDTSQPQYKDVSSVLKAIQSGVYKDKIESIRTEKDKALQNKLKQGLVSILFSSSKQEGVESGRNKTISFRTDRGVVKHSGLICVDLDKFEDHETMLFTKDTLTLDKYVYSVFISPSGEGLKILVKIPNEIENHRAYFYGLKDHFNSSYFDDSCVNESRVCYISYDPDIYINEDSLVFKKKKEQPKPIAEIPKTRVEVRVDDDVVIKGLLKWWNERYGLVANGRNRNTYILAMAFNEFGISELVAKSILSQFEDNSGSDPFTAKEINMIVESAYSKTHLFATKSFTNEEEIDSIYKPSETSIKDVGNVNFQNIYKSSFIDVTKKIEQPPLALSIGSYTMLGRVHPIPFGTYGNFSCIVGASKSKKTFLKSLLTASFIGGDTSLHTSSIKTHRDRECFVIDIDTEQSTYHAQQVFKRVMRLVGMDSYEFYKPFALRPYDAKERLQFIEWLIYESDMKNNIGFVAIDGLADTVNDFNDLKESQAVIQKVMQWTAEKQFHLTTILHSNFGTTKAVGHIGSSMLKKAETVCQVTPEESTVKAHFSHTRGYPIPDFEYAVDDSGLPYIINEKRVKAEETKLPTISPNEAFNDIPF